MQINGGATLPGRTATVGPQSVGSATSPPITVVANQVLTDVDFGYNAPGTFTVSDTLWVDEDLDGVYDVNERPIGGVTVNLVDSLGNVVGTTTSAADGTFTFSGVPNGNYTMVVTDNGGELAGRQRTTPDATAGQRAVTVAGANVTGVHFGYAQPGLIGDRVWSDSNGDGVQDPNEPGLGGILVELRRFTDDLLLGTTTTRADGSYEFDNLLPGGYRVRIPLQAALSGYTQTGDPNVPNAPCAAACDDQGSSTITFGATDRNVDFGYRNTARPDISGTVFEDRNRNGVLDTSPPAEDRHRQRRGRIGERRARRHLRHAGRPGGCDHHDRRQRNLLLPRRAERQLPGRGPRRRAACSTATSSPAAATRFRSPSPVSTSPASTSVTRAARRPDPSATRSSIDVDPPGAGRSGWTARPDRAATFRSHGAALRRRQRQRRDRRPATARRSRRR